MRPSSGERPGWKIDFLATAPATETSSGLSRAVWELAAELHARGHTPRVLYPTERPVVPSPYRGVPGVPVPLVKVPRRPFGRDIEAGKVASHCLDPTVDVVVGNDEKAGALTLPVSKRGARPVRVQIVHDVALHTFDTLRPLEPKRGLRQSVGNWLDRRTLRKLEGTALAQAQLLLVGSEMNRGLVERYYGIPARRIHLQPHGVPDPLNVGTREEARGALRIPTDVPVVLFVGRTPERQGLPAALEAFRRMRPLFAGVRFVVVGSTLPTEPGVLSLGLVDEETKARAYRSADVFLFPAKYEGFGLAPREAMRYGIATIASSQVPLEGAESPKEVRVVRSDDAGEYASELADLLADTGARREMAERGRLWADQFSYARMAAQFEELLRPLLTRAA
ncbi:MAG: glycosyltransferase family 4 protein [Thermoplasmata archaeon]|nr:glycosyltransferase family 4 protein [Thermoplasmata archaeon]